jgi:GNAT superfamily N-acetyltransferase
MARHADADAVGNHPAHASALLSPLRRAGFDYACFKIFTVSLKTTEQDRTEALPSGYRFAELAPSDLKASTIPELQDCLEYGGPGSHTFGIFRGDGTLACVQCVWFGERYRQRGFWPIEADAAVSMHLVTAAAEQGKGLATHLKRYSASRLKEKGFSRLYSRIWWTNRASLRVSEKAGWSRVGTILEVSLPWSQRPVRVVFPRH